MNTVVQNTKQSNSYTKGSANNTSLILFQGGRDMILCVDVTALNESQEVQKDVNLEDILNNHTKYFDNEEEAYKQRYVPLNFSVSIRSMYSNHVVETDEGDIKKYYTNLLVEQPFVHKGYDLLMYLTSIGVMHNVNYSLGFDDIMMNHSQFQPIGLWNVGSRLVDPVILTHVILSDEGAEEFKKYLKNGKRLVPIKDIEPKGNIKALLDTLIKVEEEKENE